MRRTIMWILVIAVVGVLGYDVWRWRTSASELDKRTHELTILAARTAAGGSSRDSVGLLLVQTADPLGIRVYQYGQTATDVEVWTDTEVEGTIVIGGVWNLVEGTAANRAFAEPFEIRDYGKAGIK